MKQIIINADDFGINEVVTSEIERMIELQAISSTTVMANGRCLEEVKHFVSLHPEISFGVHLCLSEFDSLTKSERLRIAGITDEKGQFVHKAIFRLQNYDDINVKRAIKDELNAQIDVVSALGFTVSHADSHHHAHTIYPLRDVFAEVLQKRGIKKIRLCSDYHSLRAKRHLILWMYRVKLKKYYKSQFITTDAFCSYSDYVKNSNRYGEQVMELMCHPGHNGKSFIDEMELVGSKRVLNSDIKLISYNDLH